MRLTCPNCKAQYEVDERVIPEGGRDVQCSACGNTWFQYPADVALRMRAADLDDDDDEGDADGAPRPAPAAEGRIDKTVLDVLRQEAEREIGERRQSRPSVETQGDLGLVGRPRARSLAGSEVPPDAPMSSRRRLLPDIEEISTTIETANASRVARPEPEEPEAADDPGKGREFRRGLAYVVLAVGVFVALYLLAPLLADWVPALRGPLSGYVAMIDSLRMALARLLGA